MKHVDKKITGFGCRDKPGSPGAVLQGGGGELGNVRFPFPKFVSSILRQIILSEDIFNHTIQ